VLRSENLARGRQGHAQRCALEEGDAQHLLQLLDLLAQRWLADVQPGGSARDVAFLGDGDKVAQVSKLDGHMQIIWFVDEQYIGQMVSGIQECAVSSSLLSSPPAALPSDTRLTEWALFLVGFITFALLYAAQPLLPAFAHQFGIRAADSALALSVSSAHWRSRSL